MNPAERYAALKLLEHALKTAIAEAAVRADEYRQSVRGKSLETDYGTVTVTRRKPTVAIDTDALETWATLHRPDVLVDTLDARHPDHDHVVRYAKRYRPETVRTTLDPLFVAAMRSRLVADGDDAIDPDTGEAMPWATVTPGAEYLTTRLSAEAKAEAEQYVADHVQALIDASLPKAILA